jgi:hypothetical protein
MPEGARLLVTVLEEASAEKERAGWAGLGARGLARAYGDSEPEYSMAGVMP